MPQLLSNVDPAAVTQAFGNRPGAGVSLKIKAKIWANEYVDLATLLINEPQATWQISVASDDHKQDQAVVFNKPKNRPLNFMQWLSAFTIYASVMAEKSTEEAAQLWAYLQIIQDMQSKFAHTNAWRVYDEQFRRQRAITPNLHPWSVINWFYYSGAVWPSMAQCQVQPVAKDNKTRPIFACCDFNNFSICSRAQCSFPHICLYYQFTNPIIHC
jgi:hypothetical protein